MKWIPVTERLPDKEGDYFVIYTTGEKEVLYASGNGHEKRWKALVKEWLDESASLPSSSVTGEEDWKAKWDKLYEQFKKLDEYNVNLREENKRYRKEVDRLTPVTGESEAIGELLEVLQGLVNDVKNKPNDTRYATHIKISESVIAKHKQSKK